MNNLFKNEHNLIKLTYPAKPSTVSSIGRTWILLPYFTSGQA
jgi:hypothetical protein